MGRNFVLLKPKSRVHFTLVKFNFLSFSYIIAMVWLAIKISEIFRPLENDNEIYDRMY